MAAAASYTVAQATPAQWRGLARIRRTPDPQLRHWRRCISGRVRTLAAEALLGASAETGALHTLPLQWEISLTMQDRPKSPADQPCIFLLAWVTCG